MSDRQPGWYWVKEHHYDDWEAWYWNGVDFSGVDEDCCAEIGSRIPTPDEPWQCVPVEPDAAMSTEGGAAVQVETTAINKLWTAGKVWKAMLSAAPAPGDIDAETTDA